MTNKFNFKKLALASAIGSMMVAGSAQAATTAYNLYDLTNTNGRLWDMPMAGFSASDDGALGSNIPGGTAGSMASRNPSINPLGWTGAASIQPHYLGGLPATWYEKLGATDSDSVTTAEMLSATNPISSAGVTAIGGLTVGARAYQDWGLAGGITNWGHNADFGLLHLDGAANVTITMSADGSQLRSGFSIWEGWDAIGGTRHTTWLKNGAPGLQPGDTNDPSSSFPATESMGFTGYVRPASDMGSFKGTAWTTTAGGLATLTLSNLAAGDYTIVMGGMCGRAGNVSSGSTVGLCGTGSALQYKMEFASTAVSSVPLPAAAWLFGPALAGLGVIGRRKGKIAA